MKAASFSAVVLILAMSASVGVGQQANIRSTALANRIGPYSGLLTDSDVAAASGEGFGLTVLSKHERQWRTALSAHGLRYLDPKPWTYVHKQCDGQFANEAARGASRHCALTAEDQSAILNAVSARLAEVENDPGLAGYYVLDDYPFGDVSATLRAIRALVMESNQRTHTDRAVICGIGGFLDKRDQVKDRFSADHSYTEESLVNVSPDICDIVAPYFYGVASVNNPDLVDWSMQNLMPWFMRALRNRGFSQPSLLPIVQAFSAPATRGVYVEPTPENMRAQASAYCGTGGAVALLFFTWFGTDLTHTYANDANLRLGVQAAAEACRSQGLALPPRPGGG
jgi:hypothetical protein